MGPFILHVQSSRQRESIGFAVRNDAERLLIIGHQIV